jgi:hypothetical protein
MRTTPWAKQEVGIGHEARRAILLAGSVSVLDRWRPPHVEVYEQVQDHRGVVPDIFAMGAYLLASPAALAADPVRDLLSSTGELLAVAEFSDGREPGGWAVYHCTTAADVLDVERSDLRRFEDGQIMSVNSGVLRDLDHADVPPFFRQEGLVGSLLASEAARQTIDGADLVGPEFFEAFQPWNPAAGWEAPTTVDELVSLPPARLDDRVWLRLSRLVDYRNPAALRSDSSDVAAYLSTRLFEWEVMNGGLHQYFFNFPDPDLLSVILDGYTHLGLHDARTTLEHAIAPIAAKEAEWRESLRDGRIETFFDSYGSSELEALDLRIEVFDHVRVALIRTRPDSFAR